jgi:hypothetical protein
MRKPKYATIDAYNPKGLGVCDKSQFVFNNQDLVKQMEWRGNSLQWTGFMVGKPFLDKPNPQLRNYPLPPDPVPLNNIRFDSNTVPLVPALPENQRLEELEKNNFFVPLAPYEG